MQKNNLKRAALAATAGSRATSQNPEEATVKHLRSKVYDVIRDDDKNKLSGTLFDTVIISFIVVNLIFIILDTFHMPAWYRGISRTVEILAVFVFTAEYLLRIWTAPLLYAHLRPATARLRYIFSLMALVDLVSILPFYLSIFLPTGLTTLRALRAVRLIRVFKINRYNSSFFIMAKIFRKKAHQLISSAFVLFILMLVAAMLMYDIESLAQPDKFDNAFSGFWWAISTVTTIGYGDLYPITNAGKVLAGLIAFLGIALVAVPTGIISAGFVEESRLLQKETPAREAILDAPHEEEKLYCPYCGKRLE